MRCLSIMLAAVGLQLGGTRVALAQQEPAPATIRLQSEDLERGQYGHQQNFYFLPPGKTGENYQSAGFFGQKLRPYISSSPDAVAELNDYRRQKTLFLINKTLQLSAVAVYGSQVFSDGFPTYASPTQVVAAGVIVTTLLSTIFINRHTNEYLKQAVEDYNANLPEDGHGAIWPRLRPAAMGLATTAQGQPVLAVCWRLR